jgi:hypothetical protein
MICKLTNELIEWNMLPDVFKDRPKYAARYLAAQVGDFVFRPSNEREDFESEVCDMNGYYQSATKAMNSYHSNNKTIEDAIDEYQSPRFKDEEVVYGKYDDNDYRWVNNDQ